jgi:hypothetical protein
MYIVHKNKEHAHVYCVKKNAITLSELHNLKLFMTIATVIFKFYHIITVTMNIYIYYKDKPY